MTDGRNPKADRLRVMKAVYEETGDNTQHLTGLWAIREKLEMDDDRMANAVDYLDHECLIEPLRTGTGQRTPMHTLITHRGVKEMERAEAEPDQGTGRFPPLVSIVSVGGDMIGSTVQSGSPGATQTVRIGDISVGDESKQQIRDFVAAFEAQLGELHTEQMPDDLAEAAAEVATVKAQLTSPKPKRHYIKESLSTVRAILEHGVGGAVTVGLLTLLALIHL